MRRLWQRMTAADRLVSGALLLAALGGIVLVVGAAPGARVVAGDGERVLFAAPLNEPREVELAGPLGVTRLAVGRDGARIVDSPCALKTCMGMGPARRPGDLLVCLPNRILVEVHGPAADASTHDLLSR